MPSGGGRVGRAETSAIRIVERSVSRAHAVVSVDDGAWSIVDLDSDNGTGVNGMTLVPGEARPFRSGDILHIADVSFLFLDVAAFASHLPALVGR
jgi:pSer/pThr/pTyr-binding forkhead associated (FHA) protein